jgi:hypothetical protein
MTSRLRMPGSDRGQTTGMQFMTCVGSAAPICAIFIARVERARTCGDA